MQYLIEVKDLCKKFGDKEILKNINLKIKKQEIVTIIGFSGSGKSTLLRCFNLLEEPNSGQILISDLEEAFGE
ncbi:ATP-binding cassette domain-containing protein, partial [Candidatus Phytoplasma asteris]|uniref:ATP-binding cassette domain-containing protein n=1 Tax=Candidatus Phytoplasma asteris TaxID=85620 RepID=UPI0039E0279F